MSAATPLGEVVDPDVARSSAPAREEEVSSGGWAVSSFDLLHGAEVSEIPDTIPGALFDELFAAWDDASKPRGRT